MFRSRPSAFVLLFLACTACGSSHSVDNADAANADAVEQAARNVGEGDGGKQDNSIATPEQVGAAMRASAGDRPGRND